MLNLKKKQLPTYIYLLLKFFKRSLIFTFYKVLKIYLSTRSLFYNLMNKIKNFIKSNYILYKLAIVIKLFLTMNFAKSFSEFKIFLKSYKDFFIQKRQKNIIYKSYIQAIKLCVKKDVDRWWHYTDISSLYSLPSLYGFLKECLLRRAGDYENFNKILLNLKSNGFEFSFQESFLYEMTKYLSEMIKKIEDGKITIKNKDNKKILMMGCSVWGEEFSDIFLNYCLPSLLTDGNLGVICNKRQLVIFIQTDKKTEKKIYSSNIITLMKKKGVIFIFVLNNDSLTKYFNSFPESKYWHLGLVQSLDLYLAKFLNADYHVLMPDSIYSENHFKGVFNALNKNHKIITRLMLTTKLENVCEDVEKYRSKNNSLAIPACDLTSISIKNIHPYAINWMQTNYSIYNELPHVHVIMWESSNSIIMKSSHQTIIFYEAELLNKVNSRYVFSLDSELDKIINRDQDTYCPQIMDEICLIEMTPSKTRSKNLPKKNASDFSNAFWFSAQGSMRYWKFFEKESVDPINREILEKKTFLNDDVIIKQKKILSDMLIKNYPIDERTIIKDEILRLL